MVLVGSFRGGAHVCPTNDWSLIARLHQNFIVSPSNRCFEKSATCVVQIQALGLLARE